MTKRFICAVSLLVYLAFQIFPCETQTISVDPSGTWTEGSSVTLTCTISSYAGEMKWKLGSADVAKCTPQTCSGISTGEGAFLFGFDTTNHIFNWTINPVKYSNNGNIFYCYDGTNTANYTATVQKSLETTTQKPLDQTARGLSIAAIVAVVVGIVIVICIIRYAQQNRNKQKAMDGEEKIKESIIRCLKKDEKVTEWLSSKEDIEVSISKYLKKKKHRQEANRIEDGTERKWIPDEQMVEYSIQQYLKEGNKMKDWLDADRTMHILILEYLHKEKIAKLKAMNKDEVMKKCRCDKKTTLYPLIEKCLYQDETMTKWLSGQNTVRSSIERCLAKEQIGIGSTRKAQPNTNKQEAIDGEEKIKELIARCLREDEKVTEWLSSKEKIDRSILTYVKNKKDRQEAKNPTNVIHEDRIEDGTEMKWMSDDRMVEYSIQQYLKEDNKMTEWLDADWTMHILILEYLYKENIAELKDMNKDEVMKKCRYDKKTTLYPLIEKCLYQDETMTKWLSDQNTVRSSIAEYLVRAKGPDWD